MPTIIAKETLPEPSSNGANSPIASSMDELINAVNTTATETLKVPAKLPVIDVQVKRTNEPLTQKQETKPQETASKDTSKAQGEVKTQVQAQSLALKSQES